MNPQYFDISEFLLKNTKSIPVEVASTIFTKLIPPLNIIRTELNSWIRISSGYRPKYHEIQKGRSGNSQHTFGHAADLVCNDPKKLAQIIARIQNFSRVAVYINSENRIGFIHVDQKQTSERVEFYMSDMNSKWKYVTHSDFLAKVRNTK